MSDLRSPLSVAWAVRGARRVCCRCDSVRSNRFQCLFLTRKIFKNKGKRRVGDQQLSSWRSFYREVEERPQRGTGATFCGGCERRHCLHLLTSSSSPKQRSNRYQQQTMEAKGGAAVTESELTKSSKSLKATKGREHSDSLEYDPRIAEKLAALYDKRGGDLHAIFEVRGGPCWTR